MQFDDIYRKKLPRYKKRSGGGPNTYSYKKDGFRLIYLGNKNAKCDFCERLTNWGIIYFYPDVRFLGWTKRDFSSFHICSSDEIADLKARVVECKINKDIHISWIPKKMPRWYIYEIEEKLMKQARGNQ